MEKPKNDQLAAEKLADPEDRSCVYELENNLKWMKKLKPGKARSHSKIFRRNLYMYFMNWRPFLANFSVVFWTKHAWRWAGNLESLGLTNGEAFTTGTPSYMGD